MSDELKQLDDRASQPGNEPWFLGVSALRSYLTLRGAIFGACFGAVVVVVGAFLAELSYWLVACYWVAELAWVLALCPVIPTPKDLATKQAERTRMFWVAPSALTVAFLVTVAIFNDSEPWTTVGQSAITHAVVLPIIWGLAPFSGEWDEAIHGRSPEP